MRGSALRRRRVQVGKFKLVYLVAGDDDLARGEKIWWRLQKVR